MTVSISNLNFQWANSSNVFTAIGANVNASAYAVGSRLMRLATTENTSFTIAANGGIEVVSNSNTTFVVTSNGLVGVGTVPQSTLHVKDLRPGIPSTLTIGGAYWANGIYDYQQGLMIHDSWDQGAGYGMSQFKWVPDSTSPSFFFIKSRGSNVGNTAIVRNNDGLAWIAATGSDGTSSFNRESAGIWMQVDGTPNTGSVPGAISFWTTANNSQWSRRAMTVDANAHVLIGNTKQTHSGWSGGIPTYSTDRNFEVHTSDRSGQGAKFVAWNNWADGGGFDFEFLKSNSPTNTKGHMVNVANGTELFAISGGGALNNTFWQAVGIAGLVDGTPNTTSNVVPGMLSFSTTSPNEQYPSEKMRIDANGRVRIIKDLQLSGNTLNSTGTIISVNGYPRQPGQLIELLESPCDGSSIIGASGTYTWPTVSVSQALTTSNVTVTGSSISYVPPVGTRRVVYKFMFQLSSQATNTITSWYFFVGANEVTYARRQYNSLNYVGSYHTFEWPINIGGADNFNTGRLASWTSPLTLQLLANYYNTFPSQLHTTYYFNSATAPQFAMPILSIAAYA